MTEPKPGTGYTVADNGEPGAQIPLSIIAQVQWLLLQLMEHDNGNGELRIVVRGGIIRSIVPAPLQPPWTEIPETAEDLEWLRVETEE